MHSKLVNNLFLLVIFIIATSGIGVFAQEIHYTYDAAGNRVHREYIILRLAADSSGSGEVQAQEFAEEIGVTLFPNPTNDVINLSVTKLPDGNKASATVFDNSGRKLVDKEVFNGITVLDFSTYNAGIYHVKISSGKQELFYKVLKN